MRLLTVVLAHPPWALWAVSLCRCFCLCLLLRLRSCSALCCCCRCCCGQYDEWFPQFRAFDWFSGHSWARGLLFAFDGKDQVIFPCFCLSAVVCSIWRRKHNNRFFLQPAGVKRYATPRLFLFSCMYICPFLCNESNNSQK